MDTQYLPRVLFYKLGCRTEARGFGKTNPVSSHSVSQSPFLASLLWAQQCVGAGPLRPAQETTQVGKEVALQGPGVQTQLHCACSVLVNLMQLLLPDCSVVWCLISFALAVTRKVIPVQRCFTATLSARSDMRTVSCPHTWESRVTFSLLWRHDVSRTQMRHLWVVGQTATTASNSSCMSC